MFASSWSMRHAHCSVSYQQLVRLSLAEFLQVAGLLRGDVHGSVEVGDLRLVLGLEGGELALELVAHARHIALQGLDLLLQKAAGIQVT